MRNYKKNYVKQILPILFCFFSLAFFGQNKPMDYNKNNSDFEFVAGEDLKAEFNRNENPKSKIQLIAKITNDSIITIYLKNNSKDSIEIWKQDGQLFLIQEAKNENGIWKPIEYWSYSWCGNSYSAKKIEGQKIIKTESPKYNGSFETEIRFKFLIDDDVFYTNPLNCNIDLTQFIIPEDFTKHGTYKKVIKVADKELAEKVLFLEPNASREFVKKHKEWVKMVTKKRLENKNNK